MTDLLRPLPPTGSMDDYCAIHGYEPIPAGAFRVCGECWHCYVSAEVLIDAHNQVMDDLRRAEEAQGYPTGADWRHVSRPDEVHCCPMCTHDW